MKVDVGISTARRINPETQLPEEMPVTVLVYRDTENRFQGQITLSDEEADAIEDALRQMREQRGASRAGIEIARTMPGGGNGTPPIH